MSAQDQVTIMSSRSNGGGGTSTSAARVILQTTGPPINKIASQGPPPLTSIVLSTSAASKMLGNKDPSPSSKVAELSSTKHRVKQLLETYSMTAEKSLMGPEEFAYAKIDQSYSGNNKSSMGSYGSSSYKLLPDVEISKTNPNHSAEVLRREDVMKHFVEHGSISASNAGTTLTDNNRLYLNKRIPSAILSQPQVSVRQDLVDNDPVKRDASQNHQQMVSPAIAAAAAAMSANFHQNGLVTLSKIENPLHRSIQQQSQNHGAAPIDQRQAYMAVLQQQQQALRENRVGDSRTQRLKSDGSDSEQVPAMSPINGGPNGGVIIGNGGGRQHLTGEMIRQLRQHKEKAQAAGLLGGAKNSALGDNKHQLSASQQQQMQAATYAAIQQHQMQMHAVYERALKEKSYLRNTTGHPSATAVSGSAKGVNAYSNQQQSAIAADKLSSQSSFKPPGATAGEMPPLSPISPVDIARAGHPRINSSGHGGSHPGPVLSTRTDLHNPGHAKLQSSKLAGRGNIACFYIGGEARCCLPLILNSILDQISLHAINLSCDELQIYCSTCTPEQMDVLKNSAIIPISASQCGLITKSDAERLVSMLLDRNPPLASLSGFRAKSSPFSFRVEHSCFGDARGIVLPEAYTNATARCIECLECEGLFCPQKFVCHSHDPKNRTCHWGFDSDNWRAYLHLAEDYTDSERDKLSKIVADFKNRYKPSSATTLTSKRKTIDSNPSNISTTNSHSQHPPGISRQELISPSGPRHISPSGSGQQPKFHSQHETTTDISPTKKPRLSEVNQSHGGPLQLHSIRSSSSSHHNIPPLESVEPSDVNYHSSRGGNRDGNRSEQPYSMYVYQQWAKLNPEAAANVDPSTAADLLTRAVKDGKVSSRSEYPVGYRGMPQRRSITENEQGHVKRVSSLDRTTLTGGSRSPNHTSISHGAPEGPRSLSAERGGIGYRESRIRGNGSNPLAGVHVKSSPVSSVDDYSPTGKITPQEISHGTNNHRDRLLPDDQDSNHGRRERNDEEVMHSGGSDYARKNSGKEGRTSLAEDIHSIRIALNGASTTAKERTLKTLERLTARLALAESERDVALGELHDLQKRFRRVEDELQKKRAELREALRQDTVPLRSAALHSPSESVGSRSGSTHHAYTAEHRLTTESVHSSGSRGTVNYNGPVRSQISQNESNIRRYNHNPPPALTRSGVTLELLSPGRSEGTLDRDDPYRQRREESGAELIRADDSPSRADVYMSTSGAAEYNSQRSSSSHLSRSHDRHIRKRSGNEYERNHRSGSGSNHRSGSGSHHRSRSGSRESENMRHIKGRPSQISKRESHVLRPAIISGTHKIGLPKVDLKSPARVIEEKEPSPIEEDVKSHSSTRMSGENGRDAVVSNEEMGYEEPEWRDSPPPSNRQAKSTKEINIKDNSRSPTPTQDARQCSGTVPISHSMAEQRRNSSGTPVSVKSKEADDVLDRMRSMEAELRALRSELSNRSSSNNPSKTQVMSSTVQNSSEDLDNISDNQHPTDRKRHSGHNESPTPDINEDTDTSLEESKLSIDLDKKSPDNRYQDEEDKEHNDEDEEEKHSFLHHNHSKRDITTKKASDQLFPPEHNSSNGRNGKHRNGRPKLSDSLNSDREESYRETDSETPSTINSREHDSDELSRSPVPPSKQLKTDYNKTNSKDTNSQVTSVSKSHNVSRHRIESNGSKGRLNSTTGTSREVETNTSDEGKKVTSGHKQSSTSSKVMLLSKKSSSHVSVSGHHSSSKLHKSMKMDANRIKDKTE